MKRFWQQATAVSTEGGLGVMLDGKPVRVPGGATLLLPNAALAVAVVSEWQAAGGEVGGEMSYADLPLTRLAGTAQERVAPALEPVVLELARYAETDLLCYRAEHPASLVRRQEELWQPWLDWAERAHHAPLKVTFGIIHVSQPPGSLAALAQALAVHDAYRLAALSILVPSFGSLVLGLAVAAGELPALSAHELATLDERHQATHWGWDEEAETRMARVAEDVAAAGRFLDLCRQATP